MLKKVFLVIFLLFTASINSAENKNNNLMLFDVDKLIFKINPLIEELKLLDHKMESNIKSLVIKDFEKCTNIHLEATSNGHKNINNDEIQRCQSLTDGEFSLKCELGMSPDIVYYLFSQEDIPQGLPASLACGINSLYPLFMSPVITSATAVSKNEIEIKSGQFTAIEKRPSKANKKIESNIVAENPTDSSIMDAVIPEKAKEIFELF